MVADGKAVRVAVELAEEVGDTVAEGVDVATVVNVAAAVGDAVAVCVAGQVGLGVEVRVAEAVLEGVHVAVAEATACSTSAKSPNDEM